MLRARVGRASPIRANASIEAARGRLADSATRTRELAERWEDVRFRPEALPEAPARVRAAASPRATTADAVALSQYMDSQCLPPRRVGLAHVRQHGQSMCAVPWR